MCDVCIHLFCHINIVYLLHRLAVCLTAVSCSCKKSIIGVSNMFFPACVSTSTCSGDGNQLQNAYFDLVRAAWSLELNAWGEGDWITERCCGELGNQLLEEHKGRGRMAVVQDVQVD